MTIPEMSYGRETAMAGKRRKKIREPEITGLKYFKKLLPLLERLR